MKGPQSSVGGNCISALGCSLASSATYLSKVIDACCISSMLPLQVRHHQGSFAELQAAGAPAEGPAYADAGAPAGRLSGCLAASMAAAMLQ